MFDFFADGILVLKKSDTTIKLDQDTDEIYSNEALQKLFKTHYENYIELQER